MVTSYICLFHYCQCKGFWILWSFWNSSESTIVYVLLFVLTFSVAVGSVIINLKYFHFSFNILLSLRRIITQKKKSPPSWSHFQKDLCWRMKMKYGVISLIFYRCHAVFERFWMKLSWKLLFGLSQGLSACSIALAVVVLNFLSIQLLLQNIVLIRDPEVPRKFYPRFNLEDSSSFQDLDDHRYFNC